MNDLRFFDEFGVELERAARRQHTGRRMLWPTVGAAAIALTAAIIAGILALSSTTAAAFAGWTATPSSPSATAASAVREACGNLAAGRVLASEARGPYTAIVYTRAGRPWQCVADGRKTLLNASTEYAPSVVVKPRMGQVALPDVNHTVQGAAAARLNALYKQQKSLFGDYGMAINNGGAKARRGAELQNAVFATMTSAESLTAVSGFVGAGVDAVTFVLHDGTHVKASVGNGWYLAWWPGSNKLNATDPVTILVTTAEGTKPAPYGAAYLSRYYHPCGPDNGPCEHQPVDILPGVARSITEHFKLFRDTSPVNMSQLPKQYRRFLQSLQGRPVIGPPLGLDASQTRAVSFGRHGTIYIVPGTEGICTEYAHTGDSGGSCGTLSNSLRSINGITVNPKGQSTVAGFVPDGYRTVVAHLWSGSDVKIPVINNAFVATLSSNPRLLTATNTAGKVIR